jgi:hypothetical protein
MRAAAPSDAAHPRSLSVPGSDAGAPEARDERVEVGRVLSTRGRELLVGLYSDDPANALGAERLFLDGDPGALEFAVCESEWSGTSRNGSARISAKLEGLTEPERAGAWVGATVSIRDCRRGSTTGATCSVSPASAPRASGSAWSKRSGRPGATTYSWCARRGASF